ncbi:hypothetical protein DSAG12_01648 [Promethearchaeum syntrophicum]|uniref:Uncharacterized protein n=1 Tax=Promethearchaeum syntrophicum TaxID=2594042 RepID=A0A5B9D9X5_9ARCH|nr:hypothetical protein [Candidatus Prometheoarchaeum syntrophicum]QEE15821.1 hypothetical protein DSAG12_01648 [Candidatus Prometheoarchaeum syntrophicum]
MSQLVRKRYFCRICQKSHTIKFPRHFAENQKRYPFVFFSIHKYSGDSDEFIEKNGADIITTFYVDKNLTIRDVDVAWEDSSSNIMSENDTENLVMFLTETINEMQEQYDSLLEKYTKLLESSDKKDKNYEEKL